VNRDGVAIVVQARVSSSRLPGKVLKPLAGAPAIIRMMERVARVGGVRHCVLATSVESSDDPLAELCREHGIVTSRGPLDDVLARVLAAVPPVFDTVVRLTGDCPLVDPALVERHIDLYLHERPDAEYVTNAVVRSWPAGLDVQVVGRDLLVRADREATTAYDREHVLTWVRGRARMVSVTQSIDLSALRWTLDTASDYEVLSAIYGELYPRDSRFTSRAVYRLLCRRPELIRVTDRERLSDDERSVWVARIRAQLETTEP
jgi:spore coat polysaccharide biosynthesis protein SpsF